MSRSDTFLEKMVNGPRIIIVTGHFGSGKTEFSVSLAYALGELRRAGDERLKELALCDLDIENPYFRSRELTGPLEEEGIRVYSDPFHGKNGSELQTIDASILAPVENPECRAILDTGGNNTGAMILNQFRRHFSEDYRMLYVVNQNRPGTDTPEKVLFEIREIERHGTDLEQPLYLGDDGGGCAFRICIFEEGRRTVLSAGPCRVLQQEAGAGNEAAGRHGDLSCRYVHEAGISR